MGTVPEEIVDYITSSLGDRTEIPQEELDAKFASNRTPLHYRLEQLRYLGFLSRQIGTKGGKPEHVWLSTGYRSELGSN